MFDNLHTHFNLDNINCNFDDFGDAGLFHRSIDFEFDDICHHDQMLLSNEEIQEDEMYSNRSEIRENTQCQQKASIHKRLKDEFYYCVDDLYLLK